MSYTSALMNNDLYGILLEHELGAIIDRHNEGVRHICDYFTLVVIFEVSDMLDIGEPYDSNGSRLVSIKKGRYEEFVLFRDLMFGL